MKLNPDFKARWIEALRSGKYRQTTYRLIREVEGELCYCVNGVACLVGGLPVMSVEYGWTIGGHTAVVPFDLRDVAGDDIENAIIRQDNQDGSELAIRLTELNDGERLTFPQLADIIEYFA